MYIMYYDSGTTNTRGFLLKDGAIVKRAAEPIGAKNFALEKDNTRLVKELYAMYERLLSEEGISGTDVEHIYLSGMISSPSGLVEIEHLSAPVDREKLKQAMTRYEEPRFFKRELEIIPGIKTLERGTMVSEAEAAFVNMMRGEEIEIFGILRKNPELKTGTCVLVLPGSHTQAALMRDGRIADISSNITGELFKAITKETILGASVNGEEPWKIDRDMVALGGENVHKYGFNRALYILRIQDLFTEASLNKRRSYLEGVLNVGVLDAVSKMMERNGDGEKHTRLVIMGDDIQKEIYRAFCGELYPQFIFSEVADGDGVPYSVSGLLEIRE